MNKSVDFRGVIDKIKNNKQNKELVVKSASAFFVRIGAAIASLLMNVIVARKLGSYEAGNFFLCFAIITVLSTITRWGADNLLVRYVGIYNSQHNLARVRGFVKAIILRVAVFSLVITGVLLFFNSAISTHIFNKPEIEPALFWMQIAMPLLGIYTLYAFAFQGINNVLISVSVQNIFVPIIVSAIVLIFDVPNALITSQIYLGATVFTMLLTLFLWRKKMPATIEKVELTREIRGSIYSLFQFSVVQMAMQWGGQLIAGAYIDQSQISQLAQLAVCQRTTMLISFILIAVNLVSAPRFASLYNEGKLGELKRFAINSTRLVVLFSAPMFIIIFFFPAQIMRFFGHGFEGGVWMLRILAIGQLINVLTGSVGYLLFMSGHEKDMRNITFVTGILSLILNFSLVKLYGALGGAISIAVALALQNLVAVGLVKKRLGFNTMAIWR